MASGKRHETSNRLMSWTLIGLMVLIGGGAASGIQVVQSNQARHEDEARDIAAVLLETRAIEGAEWRAIAMASRAGGNAEALAAIERSQLDLTDLVAGFSDTPQLTAAFEVYSANISAEVAALRSGDVDLAERIDEQRVDPSFEEFLEISRSTAAAAEQTASRARSTTTVLIWGVLIGAGLGAGLLAAFAERFHRHSFQRSVEVEQNARFRSLVESSDDVISVVGDDEIVRFYSPNASRLFDVGESQTIRMKDLLPAESYEVWKAADWELSGRRVSVHIEVAIGHDRFLEANGTPFARHGENVWAWRDVSPRHALEAELAHQAFHDQLTGLPNRAQFQDHLETVLLNLLDGQEASVLLCDLDGFKRINDTLGHSIGDELLQVIALRMSRCMRETDLVGRLGGDEFGIVVDGGADVAVLVAERILNAIGAETAIRGNHMFPTLSVGIALATTTDSDEALRRADVAMYTAKAAGKGRYALYQTELDEQLAEFEELQPQLETALEAGQISLHYQPIVELATGTIVGYEALMRWLHPTRGFIPPSTFIRIAEGSQQIGTLGQWALQQAVTDAERLGTAAGRAMTMNVNLSARQLNDPAFPDIVRGVLAKSSLPPNLLVLEITEGVLLDDGPAVQRLKDLRAAGVIIAIDDFGTGYTSITYLKTLPAQVLKVDRSFVIDDDDDPDDAVSLLGAIVSISTSLGMHCIGEGVETAEQRDRLLSLGCTFGQGYFFGRPADIETVLAELASMPNALAMTVAAA